MAEQSTGPIQTVHSVGNELRITGSLRLPYDPNDPRVDITVRIVKILCCRVATVMLVDVLDGPVENIRACLKLYDMRSSHGVREHLGAGLWGPHKLDQLIGYVRSGEAEEFMRNCYEGNVPWHGWVWQEGFDWNHDMGMRQVLCALHMEELYQAEVSAHETLDDS